MSDSRTPGSLFTPLLPIAEPEVAKYFADHKRIDVQKFAYDEGEDTTTKITDSQEFFTFLQVDINSLLSNPSSADRRKFAKFKNFIVSANTVAASVRLSHFDRNDLLQFKLTGNKAHSGHVTDTECRPDYAAAFEGHWKGEKFDTTLWPCIRLVGEAASAGKPRREQFNQAITYVHYLLEAKPDLHVAQGLFTSRSNLTFLFGVEGLGVRTYAVRWGHKDLYRLMYAFIYRLYDPGPFADLSYQELVPDLTRNFVTYNVQIRGKDGKEIICPGFRPIFSSNPFATRTHILSNPDSRVAVNDKPLVVVKDQLCRAETRFDEYHILERVHSPETVPGVVEAVCHDSIETPFCEFRRKHRIGLRQFGRPFTSIPTLQQALEVIFDILEVLRYLRFERSILHRDISKGNVLYSEHPSSALLDAPFCAVNDSETAEPKEVPLCFIKYLLGESDAPRKTSALLIDFDHAEDLNEKTGPNYKRTSRTGTPVFIARAVQQQGPIIPGIPYIFKVPEIPEPYGFNHLDRVDTFRHADGAILDTPSAEIVEDKKCIWRHELDHDTESVFWLFLHWAVGAQPEGEEEEPIDAGIWGNLTGSVESRSCLIGSRFTRATHSVYEPLWPLLHDLSAILNVDRHWLEAIDPRNHLGYITEAFQRLILQFILSNRDKNFMTHKVAHDRRCPNATPENLGLSLPSSWMSIDDTNGDGMNVDDVNGEVSSDEHESDDSPMDEE